MISSLLLVIIMASTLSVVRADQAQAIVLEDCTITEEPGCAAIVLVFNAKVQYRCLLLQDPARLVVDLPHVTLKKRLTFSAGPLIKGLRSSDHEHAYLRLVVDLQKKMTYHVAYSEDGCSLKLTLRSVVEKEDDTWLALSTLTLPPEPILPSVPQYKDKNIVVVIDPGHGGKDPGAAGPRGTVEKEVVLKISKQLQALLNEEPGFCAVLTRSTDCYIPLRKRLAIAHKNRADMFIAIHADAYNHSHAAGAAVYALSQSGATSEAARWLAEKENASELGELSGELADKDAMLRSVLIDLSQTHAIESSLQIGNTVLHRLGAVMRLHHPTVEQAAFVVLKSPDIPSVLVETGFLSNPEEEEKLRDPAYQRQTADAIKEGIKHYFVANAPRGTWLAKNRASAKNLAEKTLTLIESKKKVVPE